MTTLLDSAPCAQRHLFVVGLMRSGTTLLYRLLNNHPQITLLYEADVFAVHPLLWPYRRAGTWSWRLEFWNAALSRHGIDGNAAAALPLRVRGPVEALEALGRAYARGKPSLYLGSKSIHYNNCLPAIARSFPDARFIVLWRPLSEILDSLARARETNAYLAPGRRRRQIFQQYGQLAQGVAALRLRGIRVHEVVYQELVADPEAACHSFCQFLDLPWSPKMLLNDPGKVSAIPDDAHHFHARYSPAGPVTKRVGVIATPIAARIRSYEDYWSKKLAGQPVRLAPRSALPPGPAQRGFIFQRWADFLGYRVHRGFTFLKLLAYRFAPMAWLRWYRSTFRRHKLERMTGASIELNRSDC